MIASAITPLAHDRCSALGHWATRALIDEARLTPKPGLVDARGSGAHDDLSLALMLRSARALEPGFAALARAGRRRENDRIRRERLGAIGRDMERTMLIATGGRNTHRGAIWALGLIVAAAAGMDDWRTNALVERAAQLARLPDRALPESAGLSNGEHVYRRYGVGGARAEACAGFPHVLQLGLPELRRARRQGVGETNARVHTLLAMLAELDDTCVLSRAGMTVLRAIQTRIRELLALGGLAANAGRTRFAALEQVMLAARVSPGGAADLLAVTLLLDRLACCDRFSHDVRPLTRCAARYPANAYEVTHAINLP